ncbi:glycoside hydrolase [Pendulispora brunnea]|uniref:exo-alpha-sialidase n=1 Tax=Pendulispora brunnea TaxID=2905690 RepID=A0ABZ2KIU9_9BACT
MSRPCAILLALACAVSPVTIATAASPGDAGSCVSSVPFTAGTEGYHTFRIPAVMRTRFGTVLAFAEARRDSAGDTGAIAVVSKASHNGGCTWGPLSVVSSNGEATAGNPSPVVTWNGDIVLLTTRNGRVTEKQIMSGAASEADTRRVFVQRSTDDGRTWSVARDITADTKAANWRWYATGPGHAIVLQRGLHAGRIVVPANHSSAPPEGSPDVGTEAKYYGGHAIISDDGGRTWRIGFTDGPLDGIIAPNESTVAELPNGVLYFNARNQGSAAPHRVDAYSSDGGESLDAPYVVQTTLVTPKVEGSVLPVRGALLYSGPSQPNARAAMRIRVSRNRGATWVDVYSVSALPAAYSDLVQLDPATIGLLYETGTAGPYETIAFQRIPLREVLP